MMRKTTSNHRGEQSFKPAITELCVIGHPSRYGGADTELDHQISCWLAMGIEVHICHTGPLDDNLRSMKLAERGCVYHDSIDWKSLAGLHCISFCNGEFLKYLPEIKKYAASATFVNCMTWNFEQEIKMQKAGLIDFHLYQTKNAYERVSQKLKPLGAYRAKMFTPYFDRSDFPLIKNRPQDKFRFGRISRADSAKFNNRQLWIYETLTAPVPKEGIILGWDRSIYKKFGRNPVEYVRTCEPGAISQAEFYKQCDAVIMTTDTFENLPRVGFEAISSGTILIVDNRGGWQTIIQDGVTGWLCDSDREFVYKASRCAFETQERQQMQAAASEQLTQKYGFDVARDSWQEVFLEWANL